MGNMNQGWDSFIDGEIVNGFVNSEDILGTLADYLASLQSKMAKNDKKQLDSLKFYYGGHGVCSNGQDYLVGTSGELTSVLLIQKMLQKGV